MIIGSVNALLEATIWIDVLDSSGLSQPIEAVVDTAFSGYLTLPIARIAAMGLPWVMTDTGLLADGSPHAFDVYRATVDWDGQLRQIHVQAVDAQPLAGIRLLHGYELRMQVVNGGTVTIDALP